MCFRPNYGQKHAAKALDASAPGNFPPLRTADCGRRVPLLGKVTSGRPTVARPRLGRGLCTRAPRPAYCPFLSADGEAATLTRLFDYSGTEFVAVAEAAIAVGTSFQAARQYR